MYRTYMCYGFGINIGRLYQELFPDCFCANLVKSVYSAYGEIMSSQSIQQLIDETYYNPFYDGNRISSKTAVGDYQYGVTPINAVKQIVNGTNSLLNPNDCNITYTSFQKTLSITEGDKLLTYTYGVDDDRVKSVYSSNSEVVTKYYARSGTYEEIIENNVTKYRYYIMGKDGALCMYEKTSDNNIFKLYYIMKDHLGSVISLVEDNNNVYTTRARYSYDAWGRRRHDRLWDSYSVSSSTLGFTDRGFCGHEHLDGFKLINMTGRVYDPLLGVFLSPDPYVQSPSSTQGLNRYAYCMNNPVMYVDPDGELAWFIPVIIGAVIGAYMGGVQANGTYNPLQWDWNSTGTLAGMLKGFAIGAFSGMLGYGVGLYIPQLAVSGFGANFASGLAQGAFTGMMGSIANGETNIQSIVSAGLIGGLMSGLMSGLSAGIYSVKHGGNFWNGDGMIWENLSPVSGQSKSTKVKIADGLSYDSKSVKYFSDQTWGKVENLNKLHANGSIPPNSKYVIKGDLVYASASSKNTVLGATRQFIKNGKYFYDVYVFKEALVSKGRLALTLGHEYLHIKYFTSGFGGEYYKHYVHAKIYQWQSLSAEASGIENIYSANYKYYSGLATDVMIRSKVPSTSLLGFPVVKIKFK